MFPFCHHSTGVKAESTFNEFLASSQQSTQNFIMNKFLLLTISFFGIPTANAMTVLINNSNVDLSSYKLKAGDRIKITCPAGASDEVAQGGFETPGGRKGSGYWEEGSAVFNFTVRKSEVLAGKVKLVCVSGKKDANLFKRIDNGTKKEVELAVER